MRRGPLIATIVVITLLVSAFDFATSAELLGSILFALPLALCATQPSLGLLWGTAAAASVLTMTAEFWGAHRSGLADPFTATTNRGLMIASFITLTTLIHLSIKNARKATLARAEIADKSRSLSAKNDQLEGMVEAAAGEIIVRKEAAEHLAQMEARYRGLLEAAPDAMIVVNQAGQIVVLNVQAEKQFGYRRDELLGQPVTNIIPYGFAERLIADDARSAAEALAQQIGTGIELSARRKDGSEFPIELMLSPLQGEEGILVTTAIRDISLRKAAERHLARMEDKYRWLLEAAPDAMVLVDQAGAIVLVNAQAEKQFGYRRDELVGGQLTTIIPLAWTVLVDVERCVEQGLRSGEYAVALETSADTAFVGRRKDGSDLPIEISLSILPAAARILVTVAIRDISLRKDAEAQLQRTLHELHRSNDELSQFANIASHDLQEPLRMVASYTQLLARRYRGKLDADADEFIGFAVDGANRMQRLIQDLLAYSRVGTQLAESQDISSEDAMDRALLNLAGAIEDTGALVTRDALPIVRANELQLVQLFQNLIGNAIKYHSAGVPKIHVSAVEHSDTSWRFSVQDNGLGIEPQYFERIFGMFQRLHRREEFAGTGIGLAICKKIVERHGGTISVESALGQGSTFRFELPGSAHGT